VRGIGNRVILGYGVAVLYSITPEEHNHQSNNITTLYTTILPYNQLTPYPGPRAYDIKESVLEGVVSGLGVTEIK